MTSAAQPALNPAAPQSLQSCGGALHRLRRYMLAAVFALALGLRIWAVLTQPQAEWFPKYDAAQYDLLAVSLAEGRGFAWPEGGMKGYYPLPAGPTSYRAPGYPVFLASIYRVFGHHYAAARLAQCAVGALLCLVVYGLGVSLGGTTVGLLAATLTAVYPPFIRFSYYGGPGFLLSEGLCMVLLAVGVWYLARLARDSRDWRAAALSGIWLGLATLTRPMTLLIPVALLLWGWSVSARERGPRLGALLLTCLTFGVMLAPWTIRNYRVHHRFVPVSTVSGKAFWVGNNPWARGGAVETNLLYDPATFDPGLKLSEMERSDRMQQEGLRFWREHPEKLPKLFFRKFLMLWNVYDLRYNVAYGLILPWAILAIVVLWRQSPVTRLLAAVLAYLSATALVTFGSTRYRYPVEPLLIALAAAGLVWWLRKEGKPRWHTAGVLGASVAANLLLWWHSDAVLQGLRDVFWSLRLR